MSSLVVSGVPALRRTHCFSVSARKFFRALACCPALSFSRKVSVSVARSLCLALSLSCELLLSVALGVLFVELDPGGEG